MARIIFKLEDGTEIETELDSDVITIGRHPESNVVLPSSSVSVHHATIKRRGDAYYVQDLGTTNGTKLNGVEIEEAKLDEGDRLSFGDVPATVHLKDAPVKKNIEEEKPAVKGRVPVKPGPGRGRRSYSGVSYTQSSGCAGFFAILIFITLTFLAGLLIAHAVKYGGFLITDFMKSEPVKKFLGADNEAPAVPSGQKAGSEKAK